MEFQVAAPKQQHLSLSGCFGAMSKWFLCKVSAGRLSHTSVEPLNSVSLHSPGALLPHAVDSFGNDLEGLHCKTEAVTQRIP